MKIFCIIFFFSFFSFFLRSQELDYPFVFVDTIIIKDPILVPARYMQSGYYDFMIFSKNSIDTNLIYLNCEYTRILNKEFVFDSSMIFKNGYLFLKPSTLEYYLDYYLNRDTSKGLYRNKLINLRDEINKNNNVIVSTYKQWYPYNKNAYYYKKFLFFLANKKFLVGTSEWKLWEGMDNIYYKVVVPITWNTEKYEFSKSKYNISIVGPSISERLSDEEQMSIMKEAIKNPFYNLKVTSIDEIDEILVGNEPEK